MRNLYSRLGIDNSASEQEIRNAISACGNATTKEDASEVLLVKARRRTYDRILNTLDDIGTLRAQLGLNSGDNWRSPESNDFMKEPTLSQPMYHMLLEKMPERGKATASPNRKASRLDDQVGTRNAKTSTGSLKDSFSQSLSELRDLAFAALNFLFWGVIALATLGWIISAWDQISTTFSTPKTSEYSAPPSILRPPRPTAFSEPVLPLPSSGSVRRYSSDSALAPLEIRTSAGTNYFVKLEDLANGKNILDVFIRGGSTINLDVPLGTYRLKYAAGRKWYGYRYYFGPDTAYSQADSTFEFSSDGRQISGYTVTLYQVQNGNLRTRGLSPSQF